MLLVILILFSSCCSLIGVESTDGTVVGGYIRSDTVWTKEKSPYILEDDLIVRSGVSLKIQEGVIVDCSLWSIIVDGELRVLGSPEDQIQLHFTTMPLTGYKDARIVFSESSRPWKESSTRGCQFENVKIVCEENTIHYGLINGGTVKLNNVTIYGSEPYSKYYTLDLDGSISNCLFLNTRKAIKMGEGQIIGNRFENSTGSVITLFDGTVKDNIIDGGKNGLIIKKGLVRNNTIVNIIYHAILLSNEPDSGITEELRPIIVLNLFSNCSSDAIYISGDIRPVISRNVFLENQNGIYFDRTAFYDGSKPEIYYNVFYDNENNIYFNREDPRIEILLQKNWWGTNNTEIIEQKIYYENDDPRLTSTLYQPILSEIPRFLPRIPYVVSLFNSSSEVELGETILLTGNINPPLKIFDLNLRYDGSNMRFYEKTLNTNVNGIFIDEFTPPFEGIWNISLAFEESEQYSYELSHQVLVSNPDNTLSSEQSLPPSVDEIEENVYPDLNDIDSVDVIDSENNSHSGSPDIEDADSVDEVTSGNESSVDSEMEDAELQVVSYSEEETEAGDPLILGFIPSILIVVMMVAVYIGTNKLR